MRTFEHLLDKRPNQECFYFLHGDKCYKLKRNFFMGSSTGIPIRDKFTVEQGDYRLASGPELKPLLEQYFKSIKTTNPKVQQMINEKLNVIRTHFDWKFGSFRVLYDKRTSRLLLPCQYLSSE